MTALREAAQQALEALETGGWNMTAATLRAALAQPDPQDPELSAALGWPGGISDPVLDRKTLLQQVAALRAALAQQAEPDLSRCPQCNGPADNGFDRSFPPSPYLCTKCMAEPVPGAWVASPDGRVIYDDVSADDGLLRVSGDFENDEQRSRYAQRIVDKLNAALAQQAEPAQEPVAWSGYDLDGMVEAFSRVIEAHYQRANPFQHPIDMDAQMALRVLRGFIPAMKAYAAIKAVEEGK